MRCVQAARDEVAPCTKGEQNTTMPMVTVGTVKTAPLEPLKGDTGLLKILTHGHSLTEDTDHLTSRPL